jgi:regulator of sirC expression with transglutaminase-like and TPR domain
MSRLTITETNEAPGNQPAPGRVISGFDQVLREVATVCAELDPSTRPEWIVKRMQFFGYDIASLIPPERSTRDKLSMLNRWFFEQKRFQALADNGCVLERVTLHSVLAKRVGSPLAVGLIYAYLAQQAGVRLEFANIRPAGYLKFVEHGLWRYIDLVRGGKILEGDELLDLLQSRLRGSLPRPSLPKANFLSGSLSGSLSGPLSGPDALGDQQMSRPDLLEAIPHERLVVDYLNTLKMALRMREAAEPLLVIQNWLLAFQPANFQALGERALLHRRLGHSKSALADLKRYFSFVSRDQAPSELPRVYDELVALFSKGRGTPETKSAARSKSPPSGPELSV